MDDDVYFVVADSQFVYNGVHGLVVKCELKDSDSVISEIKRQGVDRVWLAKAISVEEKTTVYKKKAL